jgi:glutaredoxin
MKKFILLALLVFAGYKFHQNGYSFKKPIPVGKDGQPLVVLIVGPGCGAHCESIRDLLSQRGIHYEEIDIAGADGAPVQNKYGITRYPITLIGNQEILGDDLMRITASLAENFGSKVLTRSERMATEGHFDAQGRAKIVMYATSWCPYCKQQREYFAANNIAYEEIDVEQSESGMSRYQALQGAGYPLTYVGYRRFSGYKEGELLNAIAEVSKLPLGSVR